MGRQFMRPKPPVERPKMVIPDDEPGEKRELRSKAAQFDDLYPHR